MKDTTFRGLSRLWWVPVLTGITCVALGVWTLFCPVTSIEAMAYVFAACMLATGLMNLLYSLFTTGSTSNWGWLLAYWKSLQGYGYSQFPPPLLP